MNFDKVGGEWKCKADDLMSELEACNSECCNYSSEFYRLKTAYEESTESLDVVRREKLGDGGRSIHELDKQRRRLEVEKEELQAAVEEAEGALEGEENKVWWGEYKLSFIMK